MISPDLRGEIGERLMRRFDLAAAPDRIEAYDVAHISGTDLIAAAAVWKSGALSVEDYSHWPSGESSELDALRAFVEFRFAAGEPLPDLILIDGGAAQLRAALDAASAAGIEPPAMIAAVKPRNEHSSISHFLLADGGRVEFDADDPAMRIMKILRDEAHDLANISHRQVRDMRHFYELAGILPSLNERQRQDLVIRAGSIRRIIEMTEADIFKYLEPHLADLAITDLQRYRDGNATPVEPLIVPIRLADPQGRADDLRPINTR